MYGGPGEGLVMREYRHVQGVRLTRPESPVGVVLHLAAAVGVHQDCELPTVLHHPLHQRLKVLWEDEDAPVGCGKGSGRAKIGIQYAIVIVVE